MSAGKSRAALARVATRKAIPARLMLSAPSGAGKTWTALTIARTIVGPEGSIVVIDTEEESAATYADEFVFEHLPWDPPYSPIDLAATITELGRSYDAVVVDSMSHFWQGEGGTLDIADGKFGGWKTATPAQDDMVRAILRCRSHVVACVREKQAYAQVVRNGRTEIDKLGILAGRTFPPHHAEEMAQLYKEWLAGGQALASAEIIEGLRARVASVEPKGQRTALIRRFKEKFGDPTMLLAEDAKAAEELVAEYEALLPVEEPADA